MIITIMQHGFRKQRSTTDQLVQLETFIREAIIKYITALEQVQKRARKLVSQIKNVPYKEWLIKTATLQIRNDSAAHPATDIG